jgi:hypothetical protein
VRRVLLGWLFSRGRWVQEVAVEAGVGIFFLIAPYLTMDLLGIRPSPEAAALFRLYGAILMARGLLHHATFGIPQPRVVSRSLVADLVFSVLSACVLTWAILDGLAGEAGWAVVTLFVAEAILTGTALIVLRSVTTLELENEFARATRAGAPRPTVKAGRV